MYSGVFCLLALSGARDWMLGEAIELQTLEDHHVFPQAYLLKRGYSTKNDKVAINTICNRTLISNTTNGTISAQAPADYLESPKVFPNGAGAPLLAAHFIDGPALASMKAATRDLDGEELRIAYESFCAAREQAILAAVREVCGLPIPSASGAEPVDD